MRAVLLSSLLLGCAPNVVSMGPGRFAVTDCRSGQACYQAAADVCPEGFDLRPAVFSITRRDVEVTCRTQAAPERPSVESWSDR